MNLEILDEAVRGLNAEPMSPQEELYYPIRPTSIEAPSDGSLDEIRFLGRSDPGCKRHRNGSENQVPQKV